MQIIIYYIWNLKYLYSTENTRETFWPLWPPCVRLRLIYIANFGRAASKSYKLEASPRDVMPDGGPVGRTKAEERVGRFSG